MVVTVHRSSLWLILPVLLLLQAGCTAVAQKCKGDKDCGWNSVCKQTECQCIKGSELSTNKRDCSDTRCGDLRCLQCSHRGVCKRCVNFIEEHSGECLEKCDGNYVLVVEGPQMGKVCPAGESGGLRMIYVVIIASVCACILITILLAALFYWRFRMARRDLILKKKKTEIEEVETKEQLHAYENGGFTHCHTDVDRSSIQSNRSKASNSVNGPRYQTSVNGPNYVNPRFVRKVAALRVYQGTFYDMQKEARQKSRALKPGDKRAYVFRNVTHQLTRVLEILETKDEILRIPPDGMPLLQWAEKVLKIYLTTNGESDVDGVSETTSQQSQTLTSTFRPDQRLVPNGKTHGSNPVSHSNSFKYEKCDPPLDGPVYEEMGVLNAITLMGLDDLTDPIEV